ncbi:MAG TPA: HEAT repeat domain-containing protein [Myxococcaceae bacterium]|nr:HEAT repeat domain-containing protein [Myxococcaceae bacterium]
MATRRRKTDARDALEALAAVRAGASTPEGRRALVEALEKGAGVVAARAAAIIKEQHLEGFEDALRAAFDRFLQDPARTDPSCHAKVALLEALDFLEWMDPAPFLRGVRYVQEEKQWGPPVDTATGVRSRSAFALARLRHPDHALLMAELLADPEPMVREAAADALAHRGDPAGAALALLKLRTGDPEPPVLLACLQALLALAPETGLRVAEAWLHGEDSGARELGAIALGESRREDALDRLLEALEWSVLPKGRAVLLRALALHRSERALAALMKVVAAGSLADARVALEALAPRADERGLREQVHAAVSQREEPRGLQEALGRFAQERG